MARGGPSADPIEIECYGPVARAVHWAVAALAFVVVALGWALLGSRRGGDSRELLLSCTARSDC